MFTPTTQVFIYLSIAFLLGTALGWLMWKFQGSDRTEAKLEDSDYWMARLEQARNERDQLDHRLTALIQEKDNLKKRLASLQSG
jgi:hypothetical protein